MLAVSMTSSIGLKNYENCSVGHGSGGAFGHAAAANDLDLIGLDLKTGVIKPIKIKSLEQLLAEDPELLQEYKLHKNKGDVTVMLMFAKSFNERNPL